MKQIMRKWIVSLKHRPQNIPLVMLVLCCFIYTFNLTAHSNASMYVSSRIIALYVFIITLSSILLIFSFVNAHAANQKKMCFVKHAVVYLLIALQIGLDIAYWQIMSYEIYYRDDPVPLTLDIANSMNGTMSHLIALALALLIILLMPVYHKALLRIDTSVDDEEDVFYGAEELAMGDESE